MGETAHCAAGAVGKLDREHLGRVDRAAATEAHDPIDLRVTRRANRRVHLRHRRVLADDRGDHDACISKGPLDDAQQTLLRDERPRRDQCDAMSLEPRELPAERSHRPRTPVDESRIRVCEKPAHGVVILRTR